MNFRMATMVIFGAATLAAGCTDLKPLQAQIDAMDTRVSRNSADLDALKGNAASSAAEARSASQAATAAQAAANQALAAAQASQSCCDATNEKVDRMFRRSVAK